MNLTIISIFFISIIGTLLHFTYKWSNNSKHVGLISAVNESTWEHIKMALTPTFIWIVIELVFRQNKPNFIFANFMCILTIIVCIPLIFYSYKLLTKKPILIIDISTFYIAITISRILSHIIINSKKVSFFITYLSLIGIIIIFVCYLIFTIIPPKNFLFKDPITKKYGINKKTVKIK